MEDFSPDPDFVKSTGKNLHHHTGGFTMKLEKVTLSEQIYQQLRKHIVNQTLAAELLRSQLTILTNKYQLLPSTMACVAAEHRKIADALESRNISLASKCLNEHLEQKRNNMLEHA